MLINPNTIPIWKCVSPGINYTPEKYRAIDMYAESSFNMMVLVANYIAQNTFVDTYGKISSDKKLFKHMVKIYTNSCQKAIDEPIKLCIEGNRNTHQVNYLFSYGDNVGLKYREMIDSVRKQIANDMTERGFKNPEACAFSLASETLIRYSTYMFDCICVELKEMFSINLSRKYSIYRLTDALTYNEKLTLELGKSNVGFNDFRRDSSHYLETIIDTIDTDIRSGTVLQESELAASSEFTETELEETKKKAAMVSDVIRKEIDEHARKYSEGIISPDQVKL